MYECRLKKAGILRVADVAAGDSCLSGDEAARIGTALVRDVPHEQVWILLLNGRNLLMGAVRLSEGGLHGAALRPADVFRPVMVAGASAFVLIHNHPSGDPTPSAADLELTRNLLGVSEPLGLHFLDHLVVTRDPAKYSSMRQIADLFD